MTTTAPVLAPTREELIRALRKRHPRISDEGLRRLLDRRLARGVLDVILDDSGGFDVKLIRAMTRN
jgi:hypothetical protein